jgi:hypothetical protein
LKIVILLKVILLRVMLLKMLAPVKNKVSQLFDIGTFERLGGDSKGHHDIQ